MLFGIGIVVAGGCETGWMYRAMEGQVHFWVVGVGNVIGGTLVAVYWDQLGTSLALPYPKINLLESFGPASGLLLTFAGPPSPCCWCTSTHVVSNRKGVLPVSRRTESLA